MAETSVHDTRLVCTYVMFTIRVPTECELLRTGTNPDLTMSRSFWRCISLWQRGSITNAPQTEHRRAQREMGKRAWETRAVHNRGRRVYKTKSVFIRYFCLAFSLVGKHSLLRRTAPHGQPKEALRNHKDGCNCYDSIRTEHPSVNRR